MYVHNRRYPYSPWRTRKIVQTGSIVVCCVLLDIALHLVTSPYSTIPENPSLSIVATVIGLEATACVWAMLAFSFATTVYWRIRKTIPGKGVVPGIRYGMAIALLWFFGMLEGVPLFGNPIVNEMIVGLSDAVPVLLLGVLLGCLKRVQSSDNTDPRTCTAMQEGRMACIYTVVFLVGRCLAYASGLINSGIRSNPMETWLWTLLMGMAIGTARCLLGNTPDGKSLRPVALEYALLPFGVNWTMFLLFMPLVFSGFLTDAVLRMIIDIVIVATASIVETSTRGDHDSKRFTSRVHEAHGQRR